MAVTFERVQGFALGSTNAPSLTSTISDLATNYGIAAYVYRDNDSADLTMGTRNSVSFTALHDSGTTDRAGRCEVFGQVPSTGTHTANATLNVFKNTAGVWLVLQDVNTSAPVGTVASQTELDSGGAWAAPSLTPSSATDDMIVSILAIMNWDGGYGSTASATVTLGGSQTSRIDQTFDGNAPAVGTPRLIVSTAPTGSTVSYSFSGGLQPCYTHVAFAVKVSAAGATSTPAFGRFGVRGPVR